MTKYRWDRVRKRVYAEHGYRCAICGMNPQVPNTEYSRYAPKLTDPELLEIYAERIEQFQREPPRRRPAQVRLECHEDWEYDEAAHVQRLARLQPLCTRCHQVKHWNWATAYRMPPSWWPEEQKERYAGPPFSKGGIWRGVWENEQKFALHRAYNPHYYSLADHFMWVNDCGLRTLVEHVEEAAEVCYRRSHHEWRVDFGAHAELLET